MLTGVDYVDWVTSAQPHLVSSVLPSSTSAIVTMVLIDSLFFFSLPSLREDKLNAPKSTRVRSGYGWWSINDDWGDSVHCVQVYASFSFMSFICSLCATSLTERLPSASIGKKYSLEGKHGLFISRRKSASLKQEAATDSIHGHQTMLSVMQFVFVASISL